MDIGEILFYVGIGIGNLLIAIEWAKKGFWEVGIERPINQRAMLGWCIGIGTIFAGGIAHRINGFNPINPYAIAVVLGIPFLMIFVIRVAMPPGQRKFDAAKTRMNFWMATRYEPGQILKRGDELREFPQAQKTVQMFREAIVPYERDTSLRGRLNAAIGYQELGMLYRLMNAWEEASRFFKKSYIMLEELNRNYPNNIEVQAGLSMVFFRLGEINHACGNFNKAVQDYEESLRLGEESDTEADIQLTMKLLERARKHAN